MWFHLYRKWIKVISSCPVRPCSSVFWHVLINTLWGPDRKSFLGVLYSLLTVGFWPDLLCLSVAVIKQHNWMLYYKSILPVFMVSKNPISCLVKAPNSITLILHVQELMTQSKRPPLHPALAELINQWKRKFVRGYLSSRDTQ